MELKYDLGTTKKELKINIPKSIKPMDFFDSEPLKIVPTYSCDVCHQWFKKDQEIYMDFDQNFLKICSKKCEFKLIYTLVKCMGYEKKHYDLLMPFIYCPPVFNEFFAQKMIFEISKIYQKIGLSNITLMRTVDRTELGQTVQAVDKTLDNTPYRKGCPVVHLSTDPCPGQSVVHQDLYTGVYSSEPEKITQKKEVKEWFKN